MERVTQDNWFDYAKKWYRNNIIFGNIDRLILLEQSKQDLNKMKLARVKRYCLAGLFFSILYMGGCHRKSQVEMIGFDLVF